MFLGIVVYLAAGAFWILGWLVDLNTEWIYHDLNMFFFYLSYFLVVFGFVYAIVVKGRKAFARELPEDADKDDQIVKDKGEEPAAAPTPYVMLPAEP